MTRRLRTGRWAAVALLTGILTLAFASGTHADWITKGGTYQRTSRADEILGSMNAREWWSVEDGPGYAQLSGIYLRPGFGESSTQPVVEGEMIYHTAGKHLWGIRLGQDHKPLSGYDGVVILPIGVSPFRPNANPEDRTADIGPGRTPASSPSYSPESGIIYWGSPYGELWAYRTRDGEMRSLILAQGCKIVGSPLVLRINGQDVVVVGDRPVPEDPSTAQCGSIWAAWGFELGREPESSRFGDEIYGGWVTPSPVAVGPQDFMIGTDLGNAGRALRMHVSWKPDGKYYIELDDQVEGYNGGFAGTFASAPNGKVYWLDTNGRLFSHTGTQVPQPVNLLELLLPEDPETGAIFTNTEPAIGADGSLYITLRNFWLKSDPFPWRPDPSIDSYDPGPPGALLKIDPETMTVTAFRRLPTDGIQGWRRAVNTAPLVLRQADGTEAIALGDVNGNMYLYSATDLEPLNAWKDLPGGDSTKVEHGGHVAHPFSLLRPGETAARAPKTYSQRTGIGTDPMAANRLLMTGVNYTNDASGTVHHRLVAYYNPVPFNLAWSGANLTPEKAYKPGDAVTVGGSVRLDASLLGAGTTLSQIRNGDVDVRWLAISKEDWTSLNGGGPSPSLRAIGAPAVLSPGMVSGSAAPARGAFTADEALPKDGYIIGVIDMQKVAQYDPESPGALIAARTAISADTAPSEHYETSYRDNLIAVPYRLQLPLNLRVAAVVEVLPDHLEITAYVANISEGVIEGTVPLTGTVTSSISGVLRLPEHLITVAPRTAEEVTYALPLIGCDLEEFDVTIEVNPNPTANNSETTYADNLSRANAAAGTPGGCGGPGAIEGGERRVIPVPSDCDAIADPDDRQLCRNYRKELD
ncbi:MAG TPA: hypothetical protein VD969_29725 [Symbiobacteriaceae bacterium]|nr:hypothetical protein [Symbiobacteriaceae bacterium]